MKALYYMFLLVLKLNIIDVPALGNVNYSSSSETLGQQASLLCGYTAL
jgi:hypothetical protein